MQIGVAGALAGHQRQHVLAMHTDLERALRRLEALDVDRHSLRMGIIPVGAQHEGVEIHGRIGEPLR